MQAGSPHHAEWLINPVSSQQKENHWIGFMDFLIMGSKNNAAISFMSRIVEII